MKSPALRVAIWLLFSLGLAACGAAAPMPADSSPVAEATSGVLPHSPTEAAATEPALPTQAPGAGEPVVALTEQRFVEVEWPASMRVGDSDFIRLALVPGEDGLLTPTAIGEGHVTSGEAVEIANLYETHNVLAAAELSSAGLEIDRPGEISQTLLPGEPAQWQWTVAPKTAGSHVATLSLHLQFVPKAGGETVERAVWARPLNLEARTVLGLSGRGADLLGVVGTVSGGLLGFPFADKLYGWLWRRIRVRVKS